MPYVKSKGPDPMTKLLRAYGYSTGESLARVLGYSVPTAIKRLNNPELLTLGDLGKICHFGHIPIEELRDAIKA